MTVKAPVRLGLIGAGKWGRNYIHTIASMADVRLTRVASANPETPRIVSAGCVVVSDWRDLLDPGTVDGVIIATPPHLHAEMALAAAELRLPVLIEKPLTMNLADAEAIRTKAVDQRVVTMVDHTQLFHPAYRKLKSLLPQFGPIREIRSEAGRTGPFRPDTPVLWDWGAHDVAMCLDLMQRSPMRTSAKTVERRSVGECKGESLELTLEFPERVPATILISNILSGKKRCLSVTCEQAAVVFDDFAPQRLVIRQDTVDLPIAFAAELPLTVAVREFCAAISNRRFDAGPVEIAVDVVRTLSDCAKALDSVSSTTTATGM